MVCSLHVTCVAVFLMTCSPPDSGIMVHLSLTLWTHVWIPLYANQTLHPQQGGFILLDVQTRFDFTYDMACFSNSVTWRMMKENQGAEMMKNYTNL